MSNRIRYQAYWLSSMGEQPPPGEDIELDAIEYEGRYFDNRQVAIEYAHEHDLHREDKVCVEKLRLVDHGDGYGPEPEWEEIEVVYCYEDGTTETERSN